jgi:phage tail protein X
MATYRTKDGDMLDMICIAHYGQAGRYVESVLDANSGLAELGLVFSSGQFIELPDLLALKSRNTAVRLWD